MPEDWEPTAWRLWRRRRLTFFQISAVLAAEGWCVSPARLEQSVMARAQTELEAGITHPPSGPRTVEGPESA